LILKCCGAIIIEVICKSIKVESEGDFFIIANSYLKVMNSGKLLIITIIIEVRKGFSYVLPQ
jgi:hypothetical protein